MVSKGTINICSLPPDLLNQIFVLVCSSNGVEATRLASVCKAWRDVQWDTSMWNHAIVPTGRSNRKFGDKHICRLASSGAWEKLTLLTIKGSSVGEGGLRSIALHCPSLLSLNVSHGTFCLPGLSEIGLSCPLHSITLSHMDVPDAAASSLLPLLPALHSIKLKGCARVGTRTLKALSAGCSPLLKVLDLTGAGTDTRVELNLTALQTGCPKLEILKLSGLGAGLASFRIPPKPAKVLAKEVKAAAKVMPPTRWEQLPTLPGFPHLREVAVGASQVEGAYDDVQSGVDLSVLHCLLRSSNKLESLDITGCNRIDETLFNLLPTESLVCLYMGRSGCASTKGISGATKWVHSLRALDCSGSTKVCEKSAQILTQFGELRTLAVGGSAITFEGVKEVVRDLGRLESLDTSGCRGLEIKFRHPLGFKALETIKEEVRMEGKGRRRRERQMSTPDAVQSSPLVAEGAEEGRVGSVTRKKSRGGGETEEGGKRVRIGTLRRGRVKGYREELDSDYEPPAGD